MRARSGFAKARASSSRRRSACSWAMGVRLGREGVFPGPSRSAMLRVVEVASGPAESRVDRIAGQWSAIRAELRTKGMLLGAMTVATRVPRTFEASDLEFVAAGGEQTAAARRR